MGEGQSLVKSRLYNRKETLWAYLFIAAPLLQFAIFFAAPLCFAIYASFTNWNVLSPRIEMIGFENFKTMFQDPYFWKAFSNTSFIVLAVPVYLILSLVLAMGFNRKFVGNSVFRLIYYIPFISSLVALSVMWKWLFNTEFGIVNNVLSSVFHITGPDWLGDPHWIKITIMLMIIWKMVGVAAIYFLAALQNIPKSYYESALIDGASGLKQFWYITFPMLTPITFYLLVTYCIGSFQTIVEVNMLTPEGKGGMNYSAGTVVHYMMQKGFSNNEMGYACGVGIIFLIFVMTITLIQFKLSDKWVYEGN